MKMNRYSASGKKSRSFYIVLAVSVLSVAAAAIGISVTARKISSSLSEPTQQKLDFESTSSAKSEAQANKRETGVADERTTKEEETSQTQSAETTRKEEPTTKAAAKDVVIECSLPLGKSILKDYSAGTMVKSKTMNDWRTHNGVDFTGEQGSEIRAVCGGVVREITADASWGNIIVIEHENGCTARYCGIENASVKEGEMVARDDVIGTLGVIPCESADASHLHFEVLRNGKFADPVEALSMQREED